MRRTSGKRKEPGWLLLIHQIPPKPNYFRVKIGRRLQRLGSVALKNSVYILPRGDQTREDFQWIAGEIIQEGGEASVCEAQFIQGITDEGIESLFHAARDADYGPIADEARSAFDVLPGEGPIPDDQRFEVQNRLARIKRRLAEVIAIDFLGAPGRGAAEGCVASLDARLRTEPGVTERIAKPEEYRGRVWVTRSGIRVDRMASGWLIRRFIDPEAKFQFVSPADYRHRAGDLRFDMLDAEFTHEGDRCTFEVLVARFGLAQPGLVAIAEIVHDIDLKDSKFARQDAPGIDRLVAGIAMGHAEDEVRLDRACALFDDLYSYFARGPSTA